MRFCFQIETQKLDFTGTAKSKVGSMDNVKHKAAGGDIKVNISYLQLYQNRDYIMMNSDMTYWLTVISNNDVA